MKANGKAWSWQQSNKNLELLWKYQKTKSLKSINGDKGKKNQKQTHELYGIVFFFFFLGVTDLSHPIQEEALSTKQILSV